jgi:L-fuconolactonase
MKIDTHQHFWKYSFEEYPWMTDRMDPLRRDFLPADLEPLLAAAGVGGVVSVQARQTVVETGWLLDLAARNRFIRGVVGWAPLVDPSVGSCLEQFAPNRLLKGVRHVLHDEPDDNYMLRSDFNAGIRRLREFGLVYDVLIFERHLPQTIEFVDRHPNQVFVIDHIAKPRIRDAVISPWREYMRQLAERENVYCKLSGVITEADWRRWKPEQLRPYIQVVIDVFGPGRLMFGSDWPVLLLAGEYGSWADVVCSEIAHLNTEEQEAVLANTAIRVYGLATVN